MSASYPIARVARERYSRAPWRSCASPVRIGHTVLRDATDPNLVMIVNQVRDLEGAKRYGGSQALRDGMAKGGVLGAPEVAFFEYAEVKTY
jgi:hypothetical protein